MKNSEEVVKNFLKAAEELIDFVYSARGLKRPEKALQAILFAQSEIAEALEGAGAQGPVAAIIASAGEIADIAVQETGEWKRTNPDRHAVDDFHARARMSDAAHAAIVRASELGGAVNDGVSWNEITFGAGARQANLSPATRKEILQVALMALVAFFAEADRSPEDMAVEFISWASGKKKT